MNEIFERLIQAAAKLDLQGNSNIARFLNESPQVVTNWSKRGVPARKIIEIAPLLGVSPEWLQTGKGAINNEAMRVINGDPMLPPPNLVEMPARRKAPVISYVQAGNWGGLVDPYPVGTGGDEIEIDTKWSANTFVLKVRGDSMAPTLMEGAYIVVDPNVEWMHNRIVVVRQNGDTEVTVKRLVKDGDTYYLKPDNTNYRPMEMGKDAHICGVVVELVMKFV